MNQILPSLLWGTILTLIMLGLTVGMSYIQSKQRNTRALVVASITSLVMTAPVCWLILWFVRPSQTGLFWGHGWLVWAFIVPLLIFGVVGYFHPGDDKTDDGVVAFGVGSVLLIFLLVFMAFSSWTVRTQGGANFLANQVNLTEVADSALYPETDSQHIVQIPEATASYVAKQYVGKKTTDLNGQQVAISTAYKLGTPELQSVNGHLYWVLPLDFSSWTTWRNVNHISVGYVMVDAESPSAEPQIVDSYRMIYTPSAFMDKKLQRHLYANGYEDVIIDDLVLEVDDAGKPFYITTISERKLHNGGEIPVAFLVIDPETGQIDRHSLDEVSQFPWMDRVYSADVASRLIGWWGDYRPGTPDYRPIFRGNTNRLKIAGEPNLVYTDSGYPAWQFSMTSRSNDSSVQGIVLFEAHSGHATYYTSMAGTGTESAVISSFISIPENASGSGTYEPKHLALHKIYGRPTWVANYIGAQGTYAGMGFVSATDIQTSEVAFASTMDQALSEYRQVLSRTPSTAPSEESRPERTISGNVLMIATQIEAGNTVYLLVLDSDPNQTFKANMRLSPELAFTAVGDPVTITFTDLMAIPIDISAFDNANLSLTASAPPPATPDGQ